MKNLTKSLIYLLFLCLHTVLSAQVLVSEGFEGATFPPTGWLIQNAGSGNNWIQSTTVSSAGSNSARYAYNMTNAANAWIFTPSLSLNAGDAVSISFKEQVSSVNFPERLKVTVGNAQTAASHTTTLLDMPSLVNDVFASKTVTYNAPSTGVVYP